jgi:catechol 2,3-dioxygenase-like lactoylglutathione lyase family enzyme
MFNIANTQLWVHDQDEALAFYTQKLGWEVRSDVTMPEMGDFRWLTVGPPNQAEFAVVLMAIPGPPVMEPDTADQVRGLMAKGFAGTVFLTTDDVHADHDELQGRGVGGAPLRDRLRVSRPVGQQLPADPGPREHRRLSGRSPGAR